MKRNHIKKTVNYLSSGKNGRVRRWALCSLGAAAVFGLAFVLILSAINIIPEAGKTAALELMEKNGSYEVRTDEFLATIYLEDISNHGLVNKGERLLVASAGGNLNVPSGDIDMGNEEPESGIKVTAESALESDEGYNDLVSNFKEDTGVDPSCVMKVTVSAEKPEMVNWEALKLTMKVDLTKELLEETRGKLGMSVTVMSSNGENLKTPFSNVRIKKLLDAMTIENKEKSEVPVTVSESVTENGYSALYAFGYSIDNYRKLEDDENWDGICLDVPAGEDEKVTIDLAGYKITQEVNIVQTSDLESDLGSLDAQQMKDKYGKILLPNGWGTWNLSLFYVEGTLTIEDSSNGSGKIIANIPGDEKEERWHSSLINVQPGGTLNIKGGTLQITGGQNSVIMADADYYISDKEKAVTINMSGGTLTGARGFWGGGIFMSHGTINMTGGTIKGNSAKTHGGGILVSSGTVNMSGGTIGGTTEDDGNSAGNYGGGICVFSNGTANIYGSAIIEGNSARDGGGGIGVDKSWGTDGGTVNIYGDAIIAGNRAEFRGGGIYSNKGDINISGGTIGKVVDDKGELKKEGNTTDKGEGGGIYAEDGTVKVSGSAKIKGNAALQGGGVWAKSIVMSDGIVSENEAWHAGGGVYAWMMEMTNGEISYNQVNYNSEKTGDNFPRGGGGIYIIGEHVHVDECKKKDENGNVIYEDGKVVYICGRTDGHEQPYTRKDFIFSFDDEDALNKKDGGGDEKNVRTINCNMCITGGTISHNSSYHTGGGIFVDTGAVVYIKGDKNTIYIQNNTAKDQKYVVNNKEGHGFAGGGIFVEHPFLDRTSASTELTELGGQVYVYNAVITNNTAKYGGGVAGCGVSKVAICSVNGVAVYGNNLLKKADLEKLETQNFKYDERYSQSADLYVDGGGIVDTKMMGGVLANWQGKVRRPRDLHDLNNYDLVVFNVVNGGVGKNDYGLYLTARFNGTNEKIEADKAKIRNYATVFIENNTSNSGGGGIGGNGYMKLGLRAPEVPSGDLKLRKVVSAPVNSNMDEEFTFKIKLKESKLELQDQYGNKIPLPRVGVGYKGIEWENIAVSPVEATVSCGQDGIQIYDNIQIYDSCPVTPKSIGKLANGTKLTVEEQVTTQDGEIWYKVGFPLEGEQKKGFIRRDDVTLSGELVTLTKTRTVVPVKAMVSCDEKGIQIYEDASLESGSGSDDRVLNKNELWVEKEAIDKDGKTWYKVRLGSGEEQKNGYICGDDVSLKPISMTGTSDVSLKLTPLTETEIKLQDIIVSLPQEEQGEDIIGCYNVRLKNNMYFKIKNLPTGTTYEITEISVDGYKPDIEIEKGGVEIDHQNNKVSGWIGDDVSIVFTNTAVFQLPETGGETTAMYYLLGCALLVTASAGGWMYRKRSKSI